ncbi:MAG: glutamyl-tRNA reductase [Gammaproteobacteria bacterium]|nr:glutamyl-tRNA reductase [Gammaproteobacteria bacterium]
MSLLALGLNHKTAPLEVRERVVFAPERLPTALQELSQVRGVSEATIVSTCNRTEIYCDAAHGANGEIASWLGAFHAMPASDVDPYLFSLADQEAVRHLLRVSSGLDSLVLGEPQILGQIKSAYEIARSNGTIGAQLHRLFQYAFSVAKQVRTDTEIGANPVSVAFSAVSLAKQIFGELDQTTALLIGAGETIELSLRHLQAQGLGAAIVANRTLTRAQALATSDNASAVTLAALPDVLGQADLIISSTASQLPILGKGAVERALKERKHRPMLLVDIAVPRDIEPQVSELDDIFLYTVDDLQTVIEENLASRREAATLAEEIIDGQVDRFMIWLRSLDSVGRIREYRQQAEALRVDVQSRALVMARQGKTTEEIVEFVGKTLLNKLLHTPTRRMRQAGEDGEQDLLRAAQELFGLPDDD